MLTVGKAVLQSTETQTEETHTGNTAAPSPAPASLKPVTVHVVNTPQI